MNLKTLSINLLFFALIFSIVSCHDVSIESDTQSFQLVSFFDLRDRETYVQITNTDAFDNRIHVKIFNVDDNCNENNFFDDFTGNDTHVYNMRDIQTNDGNPSGVVLPENAYGIIVIIQVDTSSPTEPSGLIGNFRVLDNSGYEYRTNLLGLSFFPLQELSGAEFTFNFNKQGGVTFSDIVGFTIDFEGNADDVSDTYMLLEVDILDLNEKVFSCRNVIFACIDQDNPLLEALLENVSNNHSVSANVASFEYGINEAIPHSKGSELLCPGNNIQEGFVNLNHRGNRTDDGGMFVGLNNGNGRGSMDSFWMFNFKFFHGGI